MARVANGTERELLSRWQAGDRSAGDALFETHFDEVARYFTHKSADPAELVQRTFLACVEARERMRGSCSFRTFVFGVARNVLCEHYREKQRAGRELPALLTDDPESSPAAVVMRRHDERLVCNALHCMSAELRAVVVLYYWEERTAPEIANLLGVPVGTVRSRLRRACTALRHAIEHGESRHAPQPPPLDLARWARIARGQLAAASRRAA